MVNIETYGLWTNKGGVGKTTLTFHTSTAYAHLHPEKVVIVCDMCPQANLSHTLLTFAGGNVSGAEMVRRLQQGAALHMGGPNGLHMDALSVPRSIAGYLHQSLEPDGGYEKPKPHEYLVPVHKVNRRCPDNLYLLCGDGRLDDMSNSLRLYMNREAVINDPFKITLQKLRALFKAVQEGPESKLRGKDIAVFIDTNPAFTEYTQLALCSIDKLIVPVNADDFSLQAVDNMFNRVWNLFEEQDLFTRSVRKSTFAVKATERPDANLLPRIAVVVHNRHNVRATRATAAFQHLHNQTAERLFNAFTEARQGEAGPDGSARVFVDKGKPNFEQFQRLYTTSMREMFSTGVGAAHTGIPLHAVLEHQAAITAAFNSRRIVQRDVVYKLRADLLKLLSLAMDDYDLASIYGEGRRRLFRMLGLEHDQPDARAQLRRVLKWGARRRSWEESQRAAGNDLELTESEGEEDMDYMHEDEAEVAADAAAAEAAEAVPAVPAPTVAVPTPAGPNSNANGAGPSSRGTKRQHRGG